jgi:hypothetical protein
MSPERLTNLSIDFIRTRIGELQQVDLKITCIDDLKLKLAELIDAYASPTMTVAEGKSLFRVRKHPEDKKNTVLASVDEIYPKATFVTRLNRANRISEPIFYFSTNSVTALSEVRAAAGDTCTVIECKPRNGASPLLIPVGVHEMAAEQNIRIGGGLSEPVARIKAWLKTDDEYRKYELIDRFVAAEFLRIVDDQHEHEYKLSIAIAERLFEFQTDDLPIDGIAYPSIASEHIGANVAVLPSVFRRVYQPVACAWVKIAGRLPNCGFSLSGGGKAKQISDSGNIDW